MPENPKYTKIVYDNLKQAYGDDFNRSYEEFESKLSDPKYQKLVYDNLKQAYGDDFNRSESEFYDLVKKKEPSVPMSQSGSEKQPTSSTSKERVSPLKSIDRGVNPSNQPVMVGGQAKPAPKKEIPSIDFVQEEQPSDATRVNVQAPMAANVPVTAEQADKAFKESEPIVDRFEVQELRDQKLDQYVPVRSSGYNIKQLVKEASKPMQATASVESAKVETAMLDLEQDYIDFLTTTNPEKATYEVNKIEGIREKRKRGQSLTTSEERELRDFRLAAIEAHDGAERLKLKEIKLSSDFNTFEKEAAPLAIKMNNIDKQLNSLGLNPNGQNPPEKVAKAQALMNERNALIESVNALKERTGVTDEKMEQYENAAKNIIGGDAYEYTEGRYGDLKALEDKNAEQLRQREQSILLADELGKQGGDVSKMNREELLTAAKRVGTNDDIANIDSKTDEELKAIINTAISGKEGVLNTLAKGYSGVVGTMLTNIPKLPKILGDAVGDNDFDAIDEMYYWFDALQDRRKGTFGSVSSDNMPASYVYSRMFGEGLGSVVTFATPSGVLGLAGTSAKVATAATAFATTEADYYQEALDLGMNPQEAAASSLALAGIGGVIEGMVSDIELFNPTTFGKTAMQAIKEKGYKEGIKQAIENLPTKVVDVIKTANQEGAEEFIGQFGEDVTKTVINILDPKGDEYSTFSPKSYTESYAGGFLVGGGLRVFSRPQTAKNQRSPLQEATLLDAVDLKEGVIEQAAMIDSEAVGEVEAVLNEAQEIYEGLKGAPSFEKLPKNMQAHVLSELQRKKVLEKGAKAIGVEDASLTAEIEAIENEVKFVLENGKTPYEVKQEEARKAAKPEEKAKEVELEVKPKAEESTIVEPIPFKVAEEVKVEEPVSEVVNEPVNEKELSQIVDKNATKEGNSVIYNKSGKDLKGGQKSEWMVKPSTVFENNTPKQTAYWKEVFEKAAVSGEMNKAYDEGRIDAIDLWVISMDARVPTNVFKSIRKDILKKGQEQEKAFNERVSNKPVTEQSEVVEAKKYEDIKQSLPDSGYKNKKEFSNDLSNSQWAFLTAENPNNEKYTDEQNKERNKSAENWLVSKGYNPIKIAGKYNRAENSFYVKNMTKAHAIAFANIFGQESVATNDGLYYQDGSFNKIIKGSEKFESSDNYVSAININGERVEFSIGYEEELTKPTAKESNQTSGNKLFNEPLKDAKEIADKYMAKFGIIRKPFKKITQKTFNTKNAIKAAKAFQEMINDPFNERVRAAYKALVRETIEQYKAIINAGYVLEINNSEPYSSSEEMIEDLRQNKRMKIFSTESGFGDTPITDEQRNENLLLQDSGFKDVNGQPLLVNDLFRFVHDFFGHAELGNGFGAIGEENAWNVHARMYTPLARLAMTTETKGQNSWVNFSGVNKEAFSLRDKARLLREIGELEAASIITQEVYEKMKFADQKIGLLPDEFSEIDEEPESETTQSIEEPKLEGKEAAKAKVDAVAEKLKAALKAKGIEGKDVKKQGIGSDEIIDLAAQGVKAMIDAGYAVKDAIDYVLDSIKDDIEEGELDRVRERVSLKANEDLINQAREAGKSQKSTKGKKEAMERALESKGNDAKKAIFVELNFEAIANELLDSKVITRKC